MVMYGIMSDRFIHDETRRCANTPGLGTPTMEVELHSQYTDAFIRDFWSQFDLESSPCECWLWRGSLWTAGYGRVQVARKSVRIHRVSYELTHGPIPDELIIRHTCSGSYAFRDFTYRRCGRPSHLLTGTPADNAADMVREERQVQGILAPKAKLVPWQVRAIRAAYRPGEVTMEALGDLFGVTRQSVKSVVDGESWRRVS